MLFRMIGSLLPTRANREAYKREQQILYLIEHEPNLFQMAKHADISNDELDSLFKIADQKCKHHEAGSIRNMIYHWHSLLYAKITKKWDKGLDALTLERRAELLRDCERMK